MNDQPPTDAPASASAPGFTPRSQFVKLSRLNPVTSLTPEQRAQVEQWLLVEKIPAVEACKRCLKDFKIEVGVNGMRTFHRELKHEQNKLVVNERAVLAQEIMNADQDSPLDRACEEALGVIAERMKKALEDNSAESFALVREYMKMLNTDRRERLRESKLLLDRKKWEFDVAEACLKNLPELKVVESSKTIPYKEKIRRIRMKLFGCAPD